MTVLLKPSVEKYRSVEKFISKRQEKAIVDKSKSRNALIICRIEPNNLNFTIFTF